MNEEQIKAIEAFAKRIKTYLQHYNGKMMPGMLTYYIDQVLKEFKNV